MTDILTPIFSESVTEATVAKWFKNDGDHVKRDELLMELDTEKASLEVVAPEDGVLQITATKGVTVTPGQKLGSVDVVGKQPPAKVEASMPRPPALPPVPPAVAPTADTTKHIFSINFVIEAEDREAALRRLIRGGVFVSTGPTLLPSEVNLDWIDEATARRVHATKIILGEQISN